MTERLRRVQAAPRDESDAEALTRIAHGDLSALGVLYDRHYRQVLRFVQRALRNAAEAEDLAQETFLTASRIAAVFDGRESCRPWLFGIAGRLILHRGRTRSRLVRFLGRLTSQHHEVPVSPHDLLLRDEQQRVLARALDKLSDEKRVVLVMVEVEGLSGEEAALALGIPLGTVWTRLHHARRELRKRLEKNVP